MTRYLIRYIDPITSPAFTDHKFWAGQSGSGKSNAAEYVLCQAVGKAKCIDLYDSGRYENMLYDIPEDDPVLIEKMRLFTDNAMKPFATKNDVYMICGENLETQDELPTNINVVGFDENQLGISEIKYLISDTEGARKFFPLIENEIYDQEFTFEELIKELSNAKYRRLGVPPYLIGSLKRKIRILQLSGMFIKENEQQCVKKIDLHKICMDKDTLTSFSTNLLEPEEEPIAYGLLLKQIFMLKKHRLIPHRVKVYIREISHIKEDGWELAMYYCKQILKEGRDFGLDLYADSQIPKDLPPNMRRQFGYTFQMKSDMKVAETVLEIQEIPKEYLLKFPHLGVGQAMCLTGMRWDMPVDFPPTPHKHKNPTMDVMAMLGQKYGYRKYDFEVLLQVVKSSKLQDMSVESEEQHEASKEIVS